MTRVRERGGDGVDVYVCGAMGTTWGQGTQGRLPSPSLSSDRGNTCTFVILSVQIEIVGCAQKCSESSREW